MKRDRKAEKAEEKRREEAERQREKERDRQKEEARRQAARQLEQEFEQEEERQCQRSEATHKLAAQRRADERRARALAARRAEQRQEARRDEDKQVQLATARASHASEGRHDEQGQAKARDAAEQRRQDKARAELADARAADRLSEARDAQVQERREEQARNERDDETREARLQDQRAEAQKEEAARARRQEQQQERTDAEREERAQLTALEDRRGERAAEREAEKKAEKKADQDAGDRAAFAAERLKAQQLEDARARDRADQAREQRLADQRATQAAERRDAGRIPDAGVAKDAGSKPDAGVPVEEPRPARLPSGKISGGLPWLFTNENQVINAETRNPVLLRGINWSGLQYAEPNEKGFLDGAHLTEAVFKKMITEWGANIVRLPFNQDWVLRGRRGHSAIEYIAAIRQAVAWAAGLRAYTLLDLQYVDADTIFGPAAHVAPLPNRETAKAWKVLATEFQREPAVLYDLFNEPHKVEQGDPNTLYGVVEPDTYLELHDGQVTMERWHAWARHLIRAIRVIHPNALIFVSGVDYAYDLRGMPITKVAGDPEVATNIVYSTHIYPGKTPDWTAAFAALAKVRPVFAGEWGVAEKNEDNKADVGWAERLTRFLASSGIGWAAWSWTDKPHLVKYVSDKEPYSPTEFGKVALPALRGRP